jgi:hypothetical protein
MAAAEVGEVDWARVAVAVAAGEGDGVAATAGVRDGAGTAGDWSTVTCSVPQAARKRERNRNRRAGNRINFID